MTIDVLVERRKKERKRCMEYIKAKSTWCKGKIHRQQGVKDVIERVAEMTCLKYATVRTVIDALFGWEYKGKIGVIPSMLMEGNSVDLTPFGMFHLWEKKARITNDVSQPGMKIYTPAHASILFKPNSNTTKWQMFDSSMMAHMPEEPLPPDTHFSQHLTRRSWYPEYYEKMKEKYGELPHMKPISPHCERKEK